MDNGNTNDFSQQQGGRKGSGWKILWAIITSFSVLANIALFLMLIVVLALFVSGQERKFNEEIIEDGPRTAKIAIVSINGMINDQQMQDVYWQLKAAKADSAVKGLIIRINSPGGTLSGSDEIYNEILSYRDEEKKPVVAFLKGTAASGGYYCAVACDTIIAEQTTITGSIGVIMDYLVLQQLLEEKLGIQPIVVKAGAKKDWPSLYAKPSEEQLQYLQEKIVTPAYKRFVEVVLEGRSELTEEDVNRLADGSVYWADEALKEKLIDGIGYLDDAIEVVKAQAGIEKAQVVEYRKPFSFADMLEARTGAGIKFDQKTLYEFTVPQVLYLWTGSR